MPSSVDILIIDDDKIAQKVIRKALVAGGFDPRSSLNGEEGLTEARQAVPDIIILDVEMPGMNGYDVCIALRQDPLTHDVPIIFLSSHSSLRERMQGYEVGADDYLVKPFDPGHLLAKVNVLLKYHQQKKELQDQYELAHKTAMIALTGSSELGVAMNFVEKTYAYGNHEALASGLFQATNQFGISCCLLIATEEEKYWFASEESLSPLEKELIDMADKEKRFLDFGARTLINFPGISLLVRNMPLEDMERYGRIKDILPVLLSAMETKLQALHTEQALEVQSRDLLRSFGRIKTSLYYLAKALLTKQDDSNQVLQDLVNDFNYDLLRMGLDDDQEAYLLHRVDHAIDEAMERIDASHLLAHSFTTVLANLQEVISKQESLVQAFNASHTTAPIEHVEEDDDNIELF